MAILLICTCLHLSCDNAKVQTEIQSKPLRDLCKVKFSSYPRVTLRREPRHMTRLIASILILTFLAACGGQRSGSSSSSLNPFNWFGRAKEQRIAVDRKVIVDPRGMVSEVISLKVDRMPGGAIISAVGLPDTQGYWEAVLTPINGEKPDKGK
ncbi:MAG TPA: hypothetical protein DD416_12575, partial [Rhodobacteraceae bacterium]|nr:hypothetical protein [Paracoccaceae bacterium]